MAEGGSPPGPDVELLECPICLEQLRQPKSLPCLHSFCQDCLGTYITKELTEMMALATSFPCPVCRTMTHPVNPSDTKDNWAQQFPTNSHIQELVQLQQKSSEPVYCTPCKTRENMSTLAQYWCKTNNAGFCETCKLNYHDTVHNDCAMLDVTTRIGLTREPSALRCGKHNEEMGWYCEDHQILGCSICVINEHRPCKEVTTTTDYFDQLTSGSRLVDIKQALSEGAKVMESLVKDFDEQLQTMVQNQEIALQNITDLRQQVDKRLDKLQHDITDELVTSFKAAKTDLEASMQQCERLMTSMLNTLKSSDVAVERQDQIETIMMYQRGQAEVESCKDLVTEMRKSFTSVSITHEIDPVLATLGDDTLGNIVVHKLPRDFPVGTYDSTPLAARRVKKLAKFSIRCPTDVYKCKSYGVVYLPHGYIVVADQSNAKLKLFTECGQFLDQLNSELIDMCLMGDNSVAVTFPDGVRVVKVESSKLTLLSEICPIAMPYGQECYGITYTEGKFVVSMGDGVGGGGTVYTLTNDGGANLVHKYTSPCYHLAFDPGQGHILVSLYTDKCGDVTVSRLSVDGQNTDIMDVDVIQRATGIDVDREGNIYVCGTTSHNVVQMSRDGTHVRELLTSSDGLVDPDAISVCGDKFVLTDTSGKEQNFISVFQLY